MCPFNSGICQALHSWLMPQLKEISGAWALYTSYLIFNPFCNVIFMNADFAYNFIELMFLESLFPCSQDSLNLSLKGFVKPVRHFVSVYF